MLFSLVKFYKKNVNIFFKYKVLLIIIIFKIGVKNGVNKNILLTNYLSQW